MAVANYKIRDLTDSSTLITLLFFGLLSGTVLIFYYEFNNQPKQLIFILGIYGILTIGAWLYSRGKKD